MKARIKGTNTIVKCRGIGTLINENKGIECQHIDGSIEVIPADCLIELGASFDIKEPFDWQSFRNQAAKDILCQVITLEEVTVALTKARVSKERAVSIAIDYADELIKQLKEKPDALIVNEQKPSWSEEDEKLYNSALWHIKNSCGNGGKDSGEYEVYNWLKSIKNKVATQEKIEWNEEDEEMISNLIDLLNGGKTIIPTKTYINWLNAIKNRAHLQLKQCDKKDEKIREGLINMLSQDKELHGAEINWLKSLKLNCYKPSEEQVQTSSFYNRFDSEELYSKY